MPAPLTCQDVFNRYQDRLKLRWIAGLRGNSLTLSNSDDEQKQNFIGFLNLIRPNRIQIFGETEAYYLHELGKNSLQDTLDTLFSQRPRLLLFTDDVMPDAEIIQNADRNDIPLWQTPLAARHILQFLRHYLEPWETPTMVIHGVFMEVMGIGVLLSGSSGIGKSELALELLSRGHRLIADDAPKFSTLADGTIVGRSPQLLHDFLEVRGLGILNVRAMFGDNAVLDEKPLQLLLHLEPFDESNETTLDRISQPHKTRRLFDQDIPEVPLLVAAGRNLGVIVEAAVRNYVLLMNGYSATDDFIQRQQKQLEYNAI